MILQGNEDVDALVEAPTYHCFELWNRIIDEIEKEIPVAGRLEVTAEVTRAQRKNFLSDEWKKGEMTRRSITSLHPRKD